MHSAMAYSGAHTLEDFDQAEQQREALEDAQEGYDPMLKGDAKDELDEAQEQLKLDMRRLLEVGGLLKDEEEKERMESDKMFEKSKEAAALLSEGALVQSTVRTYKQ
jgi:hypothetical protein